MALKSIADFSARWDEQTKQGQLELTRADGGRYRVMIAPQAEFEEVIERISRQRPIQFETESAAIFVHHQLVYRGNS